ncbi:nucleoporin complex subunit 54-domain-containing protein, partial [Mycena pura]
MSLFGQPQQQQQQQSTPSLFGTSSVNQPQQQSGGLFGAPQNSTQQPATTSLFGQPTQNSTQQAPSLFGNSNSSTNTGTGSGLFGSTTTGTGGGLFGSTNNAQGTSTGTGLFGGQQQQQPTGGLFGSTQQQSQPAGGGGMFGNTQQQQQPTGQPATGGLFGSNTGGGLFGQRSAGTGAPTLPSLNTNVTGTGGSSLFGGSTNNTLGQQPSATSGLFSQPSANQQRPGGLFGGTGSTTNVFGGSIPNNASRPAFGFGGASLGQPQQQQAPLGSSVLSTSALRTPATSTQTQADVQTQFTRLSARIEGIAAAWNAASPQCQFQYFFYNRVDPNQVGLYGRPPNATNDALWTKAVRDNPDPSCLVPAIAVGFDDLRQRVDAQGQQAAAQLDKLKELKTRIESLSSKQHQNSARIARFAAAQTQLMHRLLALAAHLHLLVPALRSSGIRVEEEELRGWLEELKEDLGVRGAGAGGAGRMRSKLAELWALVGALGAARDSASTNHPPGGEWKVVDEEGLARIAQILSEKQAGLVHLTKILQKDLVDVNVVMKGGGKKGEEGDGEDPWRSTRLR